jgi:hypothetical protein
MRTSRLPLAVLAALLLLTGCSGGPAPEVWAATVCKVLTPWRTEIGALTTRTQEQMKQASTPAQTKENLVRLFGGAHDASEAARQGVEKAGIPDVDGGADVAHGFVTSLGAVRDAYGKARSGIEALTTDPAETFYSQVGTVMTALETDYKAGGLDTGALNSPELQRAFDEVPECR